MKNIEIAINNLKEAISWTHRYIPIEEDKERDFNISVWEKNWKVKFYKNFI
jgi:lipid II:glycine glycyltransferase (peptidoglycan interpeptide bridge formation enzyme)